VKKGLSLNLTTPHSRLQSTHRPMSGHIIPSFQLHGETITDGIYALVSLKFRHFGPTVSKAHHSNTRRSLDHLYELVLAALSDSCWCSCSYPTAYAQTRPSDLDDTTPPYTATESDAACSGIWAARASCQLKNEVWGSNNGSGRRIVINSSLWWDPVSIKLSRGA
jgi:hypothetical protein